MSWFRYSAGSPARRRGLAVGAVTVLVAATTMTQAIGANAAPAPDAAFSADAALVSAAGTATAASRQHVYADAAEKYGVPESILLAVSYLESRWDTHAGEPSRAAGYGPMHLTDLSTATDRHHGDAGEDPRGDPSRPLSARSTGDAVESTFLDDPALSTVDLAAELTGADKATLRTDPDANIRGGAAVLAEYQRRLGGAGAADPASWYAAVARYSGASDTASARAFADEAYDILATGASRTTDDGYRVVLPAQPVSPDTGSLRKLDLRQVNTSDAECPSSLGCEWIPAPYEEFGEGDYGNHDLANRPAGQKITYIVIHDTETSYDGTLRLVQDPTYVSWQYTLRASDGHIAQHVKAKDVAWHAGNWYVNAKSIGLEHEGYAARGTWYTEAMYRTSAKLVRYLAAKYRIPLDRQHILGHDVIQGPAPANVQGMHWDPGPFWDWAHYFDLLGAPFRPTGTSKSGIVTIRPDFATNKPAWTGCEDNPGPPGEGTPPECGDWSSSALLLHTEPSEDAPLLLDVGSNPPDGTSTDNVADIGSRVSTGLQYAVAEVRGDWTAVWYLGQKGWFYNPSSAPTAVWASGTVASAKPGVESVPVYGRAYPEAEAYPPHITPQSIVPLQYSLPAGQQYVVGMKAAAEYYWAVTFDATNHTVVRGDEVYYQIQFGHRVAYVKASDVVLAKSGTP